MTTANPWGLTPREAEVMDAMCAQGCHKLAAVALGISHKTIEDYAAVINRKMGQRTRLMKYLVWDRWRRGECQS